MSRPWLQKRFAQQIAALEQVDMRVDDHIGDVLVQRLRRFGVAEMGVRRCVAIDRDEHGRCTDVLPRHEAEIGRRRAQNDSEEAEKSQLVFGHHQDGATRR